MLVGHNRLSSLLEGITSSVPKPVILAQRSTLPWIKRDCCGTIKRQAPHRASLHLESLRGPPTRSLDVPSPSSRSLPAGGKKIFPVATEGMLTSTPPRVLYAIHVRNKRARP